nr:uncharacterized protein LOC119178322 [Rhipicephalus microplus]
MSCTYCNKTLYLDPEDISAYGIGSGRLTLSNLLSLASLSFLKSCPVANLRFIDVSDIPRFDFKALASAVHHSNTLRSLVVKLKAIDCATEYLTTCLCPVKSLERVCLLSKTELLTSNAERTVEVMAGQLPSILYVHIHCADSETGRDTRRDLDALARRPRGDSLSSRKSDVGEAMHHVLHPDVHSPRKAMPP